MAQAALSVCSAAALPDRTRESPLGFLAPVCIQLSRPATVIAIGGAVVRRTWCPDKTGVDDPVVQDARGMIARTLSAWQYRPGATNAADVVAAPLTFGGGAAARAALASALLMTRNCARWNARVAS
jgi:hypothetical protein